MAESGLHVAIDGRELIGRATGVGRYVAGILRVWANLQSPDRYSVVVPGPPPAHLRDLGTSITWVREDASHAGTLWEQMRLPAAVRRTGADVLLAPGYTAPLRLHCPVVPVVHDVSYFAHPEWFPGRDGLRRRWLTKACARRAAAVITVSEFSAGEIERWLRIPRSRVHLAPPGADLPAGVPDDQRPPLVLYAGSLFTRRRIPELIAGFARAARAVPDARLVLIGANRTSPPIAPDALARACGVAERVQWLDYVSDQELGSWYARARVFAFLSDYEGFGIPPLEALAYGVPSVVLDTPLSREVYGEAALRVPPEPPAIGRALEMLLLDPVARERLLSAGQRQLARYSWDETARTLSAVLHEAAGR